ncbi:MULTISPECIES: hypothetical protein [unclassified Streptomyces]|uniref:hypothetical protein n=1 Tax=unclassified Streptomyces TaxID=2593676 RepID=UPI000892054B|nr:MULTISPECIES: hypothetical protein [unclassified Streptomyces]PBC85399.1 hypothetical protein BX261_5406 [Streptomyces sp. 2321.6]SDR15980.1 hypothetical protein SAMN05216511_1855 [Streptomyces sp. KS_16]SED66700.1 hypothetical protein SAMN05428940_5432 [Streptomyces sp. 2133.1]SNC71634.1 hypothetical protein SAMN06272741_5333 [Streptomyces sp. 2114.4]
MANDSYRVDLDRLDEVVKKLNNVLKDMQSASGKAKSGTHLPAGSLGKGFEEEGELRQTHADMKTFIETDVLGKLERLIGDLQKKTSKAHGAYQDQEQDTSNAMKKGQSSSHNNYS